MARCCRGDGSLRGGSAWQECPHGTCLLEMTIISSLKARGHLSLSAEREYLLCAACQPSGGRLQVGLSVRERLKVCLNLDAGGNKCSRTSLTAPFSLCV